MGHPHDLQQPDVPTQLTQEPVQQGRRDLLLAREHALAVLHVLNVAGHRLGTAEVESALVSHHTVAEAAVVGRPDDLKGSAIVAFVTLEGGRTGTDELKIELRNHVGKEIGAIAKPDEIRFTDTLPKTRSGKIMRRLLRELAAGGKISGDTTTLEDFSVLEKLREDDE